MKYDCIVVGSGPAGSTAARVLARAGARVLLLEKERLPRLKTCGGAVSGLAARYLDVPWQAVSERRLNRVEVRHRLGKPLECSTAEAYADFVMRDRFDFLLAEEAVRAGAELRDACPAESIAIHDDGVSVTTPHGRFSSPVLIGADGAHSPVARAAGLGRPRLGAALEAEVEVDPETVGDLAHKALVSYGIPEWGYSWVFPKAHHLSVGVGTLRPSRSRLPERLESFLRWLGLESYPRHVSGHPIPLPDPQIPLSRPRVLLAGDAAGLADPLSGEGIAHALRSGTLAAETALAGLSAGDFRFAGYTEGIRRRIGEDLRFASRIAHLFYRLPGLFFTLFERSPSTLAFYFEVVRGKATYREMAGRLRRDLAKTGLIGLMGGEIEL